MRHRPCPLTCVLLLGLAMTPLTTCGRAPASNTRHVGASPAPTEPTVVLATSIPPGPQQIAYAAETGDWSVAIYLAEADGSNAQALTAERRPEAFWSVSSLDWSSDGTLLAFVGYHDNRHQAYLVGADGSNLHVISSDDEEVQAVAWSPDGRELAIVRSATAQGPPLSAGFSAIPTPNNDAACCNAHIHLLTADGAFVRNLTPNDAQDSEPAWSPDGRWLAVTRRQGAHAAIYLLAADGSSARRLSVNTGDASSPSWSPDGTQLAYALLAPSGPIHGTLHIVRADGSGDRVVSVPNADAWSPRWSPDGLHLACVALLGPNVAVWVLGVDGSAPHRVTDVSTEDGPPAWSPDGRQLAFASQYRYATVHRLYIASADGTDWVGIADWVAVNDAPAWRP